MHWRSFFALALPAVALAAVVACAEGTGQADSSAELRRDLESFFEAVLNGDVAALDGYVSDGCPAKAEFVEQAQELSVLRPVEVTVPDGAFLFDVEGDVAVAKRNRGGPLVLVDGEPAPAPVRDFPLKLVREGGAWRVENCGAYVFE